MIDPKDINYQSALEGCKQGKVTEELKQLYLMPVREMVPWIDFPDWARPDFVFDDVPHEG